MEVCKICHQEIKPDEKYMVLPFGGKEHVICYEKQKHIRRVYLTPTLISFWIGIILLVVGIYGVVLGPEWTWPFGGSITMLVIGAVSLVITIACGIALVIKLHSLRTNDITSE